MVDLAIVLAVAAGAFAGWRKGFIVPLVVQAGALLSLATLYAGPFSGAVPSGFAGLGLSAGVLVLASSVLGLVGGLFARLVYTIGAFAKLDKAAGIPLGAATAALTLYVALIGVVAVDGWLAPIHNKTALGTADLTALEGIAAKNPALAMFADPTAIQAVADAAVKAPIATDQLTKYDAALGVYELQVRPQLLSSRLAPLILSLGEGLPVVGRHVDFPTK